MIPHDYVTDWRREAPWVEDVQIEQDLVISRALVEIFSQPLLHDALAFVAGRRSTSFTSDRRLAIRRTSISSR